MHVNDKLSMNNDVISKPVLSTTINKITNNSYLASRVNLFIPNPDTEWGLPWEVSGIAEHVANIAAWVKPWKPAKFGLLFRNASARLKISH